MSRRHPLQWLAAALAAFSLGASAAPRTVTTVSESAGPIREFVAETTTRRRPARRQQLNKPKPLGKNSGWAVDRAGNAIDGRGDFRSAKRLRRAVIQRMAGVPLAARKWVRVRRVVRHQATGILQMPMIDLLRRVGPV